MKQTAITAYDIAKTVDFWGGFGMKYLSVLERNKEKSNNVSKLRCVVVGEENKKLKNGVENDKGILGSRVLFL